MLGFGKPKAPPSAATTVPDAHEEREAAVQRAIDHADAEHERRCAELTDALAQAHAEQARAVRAARANADAHRANLDRKLASEIQARLYELVDQADATRATPRSGSSTRGQTSTVAPVASWAKASRRRTCCMRFDARRASPIFTATPRLAAPWSTTPTARSRRFASSSPRSNKAIACSFRTGCSGSASRSASRRIFRSSTPRRPRRSSVTRPERDQRAALADLDERRERERQTRAAAALVPSPSTKRDEVVAPLNADPGWFPAA
jgi:hypothetical protein